MLSNYQNEKQKTSTNNKIFSFNKMQSKKVGGKSVKPKSE